MEITGKVIEINLNTQVPKNGGGTYPGATITFRDGNGKVQEKGFHSNALKFNAALKNGLENLVPGDEFTAVIEKKDDFWNWISVSKGSVPASNSAPSKPQTGVAYTPAKAAPSTYATAEERAQTQKQIVRQSSLANALKLLELNGNKKATANDVMVIADYFVDYVMGYERKDVPDPIADILNMEDDIPY